MTRMQRKALVGGAVVAVIAAAVWLLSMDVDTPSVMDASRSTHAVNDSTPEAQHAGSGGRESLQRSLAGSANVQAAAASAGWPGGQSQTTAEDQHDHHQDEMEPQVLEAMAAKLDPKDLKKLGYVIDESYMHMSLGALRAQAQGHDAEALTHLAERYLFDLAGNPEKPGFDSNIDYPNAARSALQEAFVLGRPHAAAMISESLLTEGRVIEAAAWSLVAEQAGDSLSADWFKQTADYKTLDAAQLADAQRMFESLNKSLTR